MKLSHSFSKQRLFQIVSFCNLYKTQTGIFVVTTNKKNQKISHTLNIECVRICMYLAPHINTASKNLILCHRKRKKKIKLCLGVYVDNTFTYSIKLFHILTNIRIYIKESYRWLSLSLFFHSSDSRRIFLFEVFFSW